MFLQENVNRERKKVVESTQGRYLILSNVKEKVLESSQGRSLICESFLKGCSLICDSYVKRSWPYLWELYKAVAFVVESSVQGLCL